MRETAKRLVPMLVLGTPRILDARIGSHPRRAWALSRRCESTVPNRLSFCGALRLITRRPTQQPLYKIPISAENLRLAGRTAVRARCGHNCRLSEVKLDAHDKICQQVVERRINSPQVIRRTGEAAPRQCGDTMKSHQRLSSKMLHRMFETQLGSLDE